MYLKIRIKAFIKSRKYPHMYNYYLWKFFYESIGFTDSIYDMWFCKNRIKITRPDIDNILTIINYDEDEPLVFRGKIYNFKEFKFILKRVINGAYN